MSYRSIKRVLGETSLERKCRLLFGACLFVLITASFWWYGNQTEKMVYERNPNTGRLLVDQILYLRHWESLETNKDFQDVVRRLTKSLSKEQYKWTFIKPKSTNIANTPKDEFEGAVLDRFDKQQPKRPEGAGSDEFAQRLVNDNNEYQYYQPVYAEQSCLICHNVVAGGFDASGTGVSLGGTVTPGASLAEGDLIAVVKVSIPNGPTQRMLAWNRAILLATAIITMFLAMIASYAIVRYVIVKPLRHLRDVSEEISRGNTEQRADIHTGDEFEELALAFNRMLRHLTGVQQELREANTSLDGKVDELAQANMRLYELNMLKSDFLATMSHELRTPLNSILGFSEVLESIDRLDDKQKRYVRNIQTSGRTLLEMINDILDLAKIESGKMETRLSDFRINHIVAAQCDMARPLAERKNIDLEYRVDADLPPLHQDQARIQQILNNLLSNAIKFTPEGGRVMVAARRDDSDSLVLRVSDTGVGIAPEDQRTIFDKFRQGRTAVPGEDAMTREYSGTGLGLSIVKELCRLLGGEISVQSELGKGSDFIVRLPWTLEEQSRLDASVLAEYEKFAKHSFDGQSLLKP